MAVNLIHVMHDIHIPSPCRVTDTQCNFQRVSKSRVTPNSYHSTLSLRDNHDHVFSSRVTLDSYHSTLSLRDNHDRVFSLLGNITFRPTLRTSYIHTEISDISGSITPTQKFRISSRVSYTHTEIWDLSSGLLHPHRNLG